MTADLKENFRSMGKNVKLLDLKIIISEGVNRPDEGVKPGEGDSLPERDILMVRGPKQNQANRSKNKQTKAEKAIGF